RAMVGLQTDAARDRPGASEEEVVRYLEQAREFLAPAPPRLVAVGGLSGTGKSVLARALAPGLGAAPGAVLLASDLIRKPEGAAAGRLGAQAYTPQARGAVYDRMLDRATELLEAGRTVLLDATFLDPAQRAAAARVADAAGMPFDGLWLTAPRAVLEQRVAGRRGDASDADLAVLHRQLESDPDTPRDWSRLKAGEDPAQTLAAAQNALER
ncbi:MAG: AAA family ATPase, partial [Gammaproteobacteria bacterium]|nr:AAA family ATPase [Gammaproteobacteria bacterium]